jgi:hypothetical protein
MAGSPPLSPKAAAAAEAAEAARKERQATRDAALAQTAKAEQEAADAAKEIDALAAGQREALQRAAAARKATAAALNDAQGGDDHSSDGSDLHSTMLQHEAAVMINLHAQAMGVQNIRSLVHSVLDIATGNYNHWRDEFVLVVGKYSLEDQVLNDTPVPNFPDWVRMDCIIKSWIEAPSPPILLRR